MKILKGRVVRLEQARARPRGGVVTVRPGETEEEACARCGATGPVIIVPERQSMEEWLRGRKVKDST